MKKYKLIQKLTFSLVLIFSLKSFAVSELTIANKGRSPGSKLKMKSSKVPTFPMVEKVAIRGMSDIKKVKEIPKLDIGEEPTLRFEERPLPITVLPEQKFKSIVKFPMKSAMDKDKKPTAKNVEPAKSFVNLGKIQNPANLESFPEVAVPPLAETNPIPSKIDEFTPNHFQFFQGLIFQEIHKSYNMSFGLFAELVKDPSIKVEATYQLGLASYYLGLYSEFKSQMSKILEGKEYKESSKEFKKETSEEWQKQAALRLAEFSAPGDLELVEVLDPKFEKWKIEPEKSDQFQLNRAKLYMLKNDLTRAQAALDEIPQDSPKYVEALYLKSIFMYRTGQITDAIGLQQTVLDTLWSKNKDAELRSISALTLGRMYFQLSKYKEAFEAYLKVDKKHPDWMQAMVEQAWTQIMIKDYEGAAGNMFSLHTDFFKKAYAPESYIVRTVGYLNLCQFGDGSKVVNDLRKKYNTTFRMMEAYEASHKSPDEYYQTLKNWIKNPNQPVVDNLPREVLFYATRDNTFTHEQNKVNSIEDQVNTFNNISLEIVKKERSYTQAQVEAKNKIAENLKKIAEIKDETTKHSLKLDNVALEKNIEGLKIEQALTNKARNSIKDVRTVAMARMDKEKTNHRSIASLALKKKLGSMKSELSMLLDQSELLTYEVLSGAGEHLRYQMAGGETKDKQKIIKEKTDKNFNWDFRGEVWEDEIGHFRSSLENVCPKDENRKTANE